MLKEQEMAIVERIWNSFPESLKTKFNNFKNSEEKYLWRPEVIKDLNLTKSELEVAKLMLLGRSNEEMANKLFVTKAAIKWHVNNIFKKANVKNRWQFIVSYTEKKKNWGSDETT